MNEKNKIEWVMEGIKPVGETLLKKNYKKNWLKLIKKKGKNCKKLY